MHSSGVCTHCSSSHLYAVGINELVFIAYPQLNVIVRWLCTLPRLTLVYLTHRSEYSYPQKFLTRTLPLYLTHVISAKHSF